MTKRAPLIDANGEVRELTGADLRRFKSADQVLPTELLKTMGIKPRGPQKAPTGAGWQTRIDAALKDWLRTHSPI
jgi:hypothetical protein